MPERDKLVYEKSKRVSCVIPMEWMVKIDKQRGPFETRSVWLKTIIYNHLLKSGEIDPLY